DHELVGLLARPLGQPGVDRDIAAKQRLQAGTEISNHTARAHGDAADKAEIADDSVAGHIIGRRHKHWLPPTRAKSTQEGRPNATMDRHSMMLATTPAPTVLPPSLIANRSFSSIAIGTISVTSIAMLSPGITISVPSGSDTTPVTSVVRK